MARACHVAGRTTSFTGDGRCDILVRNYYTGQLLLFRHRGVLDGLDTYEDGVVVSTDFGPRSVDWLSVGDFTGNGLADILVVTPQARCVLHANVYGTGGLAIGVGLDLAYDLSHRVYHSLVLADINGDGKVDIVGRRAGSGRVEVILNDVVAGTHALSEPISLTTLAPTDYLVGMADVTGNGRLDLVVSRGHGEIAAYEFSLDADRVDGVPSGEIRRYPVVAVPGGVRVVAVTDIDGDGRPDILGVRADGALVTYPHRGGFDPHDPLGTFAGPVVVGLGWGEFDLIN